MTTATRSTAASGNPSTLAEIPSRVNRPFVDRIELTNNSPIATATTTTTPFGFATADQGDDLVATVREMRAALITAGICVDATANAD